MTGKERLLVAMNLGIPDRVPCTPDFSNMMPCKLTGLPFWDVYLYQRPPLWKAYIDAARFFGIDGWTSLWMNLPTHPDAAKPTSSLKSVIIDRTPERIVTRLVQVFDDGHEEWWSRGTVYYIADPPTDIDLSVLGYDLNSREYEDITGVEPQKEGIELLEEVMGYMGDQGIVGAAVSLPGLTKDPQTVYDYYDNPDEMKRRCRDQEESIVQYTRDLLTMCRPDYVLIGSSGHMIFNPPRIFEDLGLSTLVRVTAVCKEFGVPTMLHCCGAEKELVRYSAEYSDLNCINPLEIPPMGDCILKDLKQKYGKKLCLMGNLHTTDVMLRGTPDEVEMAARQAIDDAGEGGGFILSTGDQCGRDTPFENITKLVEVCETYGRY